MAITEGSLLEITLKGSVYSQTLMNVWQYEVGGTFSGIDIVSVASAWWNHVKTAYRGVATATYTEAFQSVYIRQLDDPSGEYGEYAIPLAEQAGTRSAGSSSEGQTFTSMGVRLTVGTRVTRPGQKRLWGFNEADYSGPYFNAGAVTAGQTLMDVMSANMTLGIPALGMDLNPIVTRKDPATGAVLAHQPVVGYVINTLVTTQNSRKLGRGV